VPALQADVARLHRHRAAVVVFEVGAKFMHRIETLDYAICLKGPMETRQPQQTLPWPRPSYRGGRRSPNIRVECPKVPTELRLREPLIDSGGGFECFLLPRLRFIKVWLFKF
jgi:hypothetical protein